MNELAERLTVDQPIVMGGADPTVEELRNRTGEMGLSGNVRQMLFLNTHWNSKYSFTAPT